MTIGTKLVKKCLAGLLLAALLILPSQALAYNMDIRNPYSDKMFAAVIDYDDQIGTWRCHGWFEIKPFTARRIFMPSSTDKNAIYLYVKTSEASWGGEGIPSSVVRTVISQEFKYYDGQPCPPGSGRQEVFFARYELEDGFLYWSPE